MVEANKKSARDMENTLVALLTQPTLPEAAKAAGVSYTTLWRRLKDPGLQTAYREARRESVGQALAQLQLTSNTAVEALQDIIGDPKVSPSARVAAARTVLEMAQRTIETEDFQARLESIERTLQDMPSPEDDWKHWATLYRRMELLEERMPAGLSLLQQIQFRAMAAALTPRERDRLIQFCDTQPSKRVRIMDLPPDLEKAGSRYAVFLDEISLSFAGKSWPELVREANAGPDQIPRASRVDEGRKEPIKNFNSHQEPTE
jgi:AcrR family transcriptional regulator